jgi:hypothetical protein
MIFGILVTISGFFTGGLTWPMALKEKFFSVPAIDKNDLFAFESNVKRQMGLQEAHLTNIEQKALSVGDLEMEIKELQKLLMYYIEKEVATK